MKKIFLIKQYILYFFKAKNAHGIHSPFVFEFIQDVLQDTRHFYAFDEIKKLRTEMYANKSLLNILDFGAGSHKQNLNQRRVCDIAKTAGRTAKMGKLLFRLVDKYKPNSILELGTSMGLGTSYLAKANSQATVITIEGSPEIATQASTHFESISIDNITQKIGNFDEVLVPILASIQSLDFLFIDGNHRKIPTLNYFEQAKPYLHANSIVVFDDIHWSPDMHEAWLQIIDDKAVHISIDLFFIGIVFFKSEFKEKQHFVLRF